MAHEGRWWELMALDEDAQQTVAFRPGRLQRFPPATERVREFEPCGVRRSRDKARTRLRQLRRGFHRRLGRTRGRLSSPCQSAHGPRRTSYFVPSVDRLFLAVRAASLEPAAVWVYRPMP
jgi:hypothetical protein